MSGEEKSQDDLPKTPAGEGQRWQLELDAARKALQDWHKQGAAVDEVYRDESESEGRKSETRWALFWSSTTMQMAMLFGNVPKVDVSRRYADADDDPGRIASEIQERLLNTDIERDSDTTSTALGYALQDWRVPGAGFARLRYVMEEEEAADETGQPALVFKREDVEVDYVHWRDVLWSPCRVWHEARWLAFAADISREKAVKRFGEEIANRLPVHPRKKEKDDPEQPWDRIRVWEIWDKDRRCVYWYCEGFPEVLDHKEDPLGLDGFWPCPRPLMANLTTSKLVPKPDYHFAQDQYRSINNLTTRIDMLTDAVKVAGAYDKKAGEQFASLLDGGQGNKLIPVDNWAMWAEKGGVKGMMDLIPLEPVVQAISALVERRREEVEALYQITGQSDIMRGSSAVAGEAATTSAAKARFGSVRIQSLQDEFARFTSDVQRLKAEIISKHFRPETILDRSNAKVAFAKEQPGLVEAAVELIKSRFSDYRIVVRPESVALTDFAALRSEKTEVIGALSQFFAAAAPVAQAVPGSLPFLLRLLQNAIAGLKGASTMEGTLDQAITAAEQQAAQQAANPQQAPPDPKVQAQQLKLQGDQAKASADMQKEQFKLQADLTRIQAETQAHDQQEQSQAQWNVREAAQKQMVQNSLKPAAPSPGQGRKPGGAP